MKKLYIVLFALFATLAAVSVSVSAAEIGRLSVSEGVVHARVFGDNVRVYFATESGEAVTGVISGKPNQNGYLEMDLGGNPEGKLYLWKDGSITPRSAPYILKNGRAYPEGDSVPVPEYSEEECAFDDDVNLVVVSSVSDGKISGVMNGDNVSLELAENVEVMGCASAVSDIRTGDIILPAFDGHGVCGKIDVMMTQGLKSNPKWSKPYMDRSSFENKLGTYPPAHGSEKTVNVVVRYVKKSLSRENATLEAEIGNTKKVYEFESAQSPYTRIIERQKDSSIYMTPSVISGTSLFAEPDNGPEYYCNYLFMRVNVETGKVKEAVLICPVTDFGETVLYDTEYGGTFWSLGE